MRLGLTALSLLVASGSMAACAAITGLDGIKEDPCFPDLCSDGAAGADAPDSRETSVPEATAEASADAVAEVGPDALADGFTDAPAEAVSDDVADVSEEVLPRDGSADALDEPAGDADAALASDADSGPLNDVGQDAPAEADAPSDAATAPDAPDAACGTVYLQDSFAGNAQGWTLDATWSIAPACASPPAPQKGNPDPTRDHTATPGSGVVGAFVCGNNPTGQVAAFRYATSPSVDTSGAASLKLGFWRWLNSDASGWMTSTVDVYDGSAWVNVYTNPSGTGNLVTDAAWTHEEYDVTAEKNAAFRVRFGYAIVDAGVYAMSAWNVDDVTVSSASCD